MPTVLRSGPYRFFFYSGDRDEPPHVHVVRDDCEAKFWLDPVRVARSHGFSARDLNQIQGTSWIIRRHCWSVGMSSSATEIRIPSACDIVVTADALTVALADGRTLSVPLTWYPRLWHGTPEERSCWRFIGDGHGIHWPDLDEDISVEDLLEGRPSGESQASLKAWLQRRSAVNDRAQGVADSSGSPGSS